MKSLVSGLLALTMAFSLAGCGKAAVQAAPVPVPTQQTKALTFEKNGEAVTAQAKLHKGQGYAIYILDSWNREAEFDDRVYTESWETLERDDVELEIRHLDQRTLEEAQNWMVRQEEDFVLTEDDQGNLSGMDRLQEDRMEVRFFGGENGADRFALVLQYPARNTNGWDSALLAMADTFQITQEPVSGS